MRGVNFPKNISVNLYLGLSQVGGTSEEVELYDTDEETSDEKFQHIMAADDVFEKGKCPKLPASFKLNDPYPGEPPFMKLRKQPAVLRLHKYKVENDPKAYWFSEAMLYLPHEDEEDLNQKIALAMKPGEEEAQKLFVDKITQVYIGRSTT